MDEVAVLMSTYNGEKYLGQQIDSILRQKDINVQLFIRDDGSCDGTRDVLNKYKKINNVSISYGDNVGYVKSFFKLIELYLHTPQKADFVAFSDQDDFWLSDKLKAAVDFINHKGKTLYFSNLTFTNNELTAYGVKDYSKYKKTFGSAMAMSSVAGCTMVLTNDLIDCIPLNVELPSGVGHDAWIYKYCLGAGYQVVFDKHSHILFRRHTGNASLGGGGIKKKLDIAFSLLKENRVASRILCK